MPWFQLTRTDQSLDGSSTDDRDSATRRVRIARRLRSSAMSAPSGNENEMSQGPYGPILRSPALRSWRWITDKCHSPDLQLSWNVPNPNSAMSTQSHRG